MDDEEFSDWSESTRGLVPPVQRTEAEMLEDLLNLSPYNGCTLKDVVEAYRLGLAHSAAGSQA